MNIINKQHRLFMLVCAALMFVIFLSNLGLVTVANAALTDSKIGITTDSSSYWTTDGTAIAGSISGTSGFGSSKKTTTLTITNNYTSEATLRFSYTVSITNGNHSSDKASSVAVDGSLVVDGSSLNAGESLVDNGSFEKNLSSGNSITITLVGGRGAFISGKRGTASINITGIELVPLATVEVSFQPSSTAYSVAYYANSTTTTASTLDVSQASASAKGEKAKGFTVTATGFVCIGANYSYTTTDEAGNTVTTSGYIEATNGKLILENGYIVTPILVEDSNGEAPFLVNGTSYWTWETAITAAKATTSKTVILADNYILPGVGDTDILTRNALTSAGGTYVNFTLDSDKKISGVTYKIPSDITFLIPYDSDHTGLNNSNYPNILTLTDEDFTSANYPTPYEKGTLTVSSGTTIASEGTFIINGKQVGATWRFTGSACGPYGLVKLTDSTSKLHVQSGTLYCYGYVTGSGTVEVNSGATVYELMQLRDWRGFTASVSWMGVNVNTSDTTDVISKLGDLRGLQKDPVSAQKNNRSFVFSQYYVQNVESKLQLNVGAALNTVLTMNTKKDTPQEIVPFASGAGGKGFLKLSGSGSLTRAYDSSSDRITYTANCDVTTGSIQLTFGVSMAGIINTEIDLDTIYNILAFNSNMSIIVGSGHTMTLASDLKLLPEASIEVKPGGNLVLDGAELYIYDKTDWLAGSYAYNADLHQLHYVATRNGAPVVRSIDESAKLKIDGTMTIEPDGYLFTTVGYTRNGATAVGDAKNMDKIITGSGKIINKSVYPESPDDSFGKLDEFEFGSNNWTVTHQITTTPFVGRLSGITSDLMSYHSFAGSETTYYGLGSAGNNYWYNYLVSAVDDNGNYAKEQIAVVKTAQSAESSIKRYDSETAVQNVVGYVTYHWDGDSAEQSIFTFTVEEGYIVYKTSIAEENKLPPDETGVYTLSSVTSDTTLVLHKHTSGTAEKENETAATCTTAGSYDSVVYCTDCGEELSRTQETEPAAGHSGKYALVDGMYIRTCTVCGETETEYPVQLMGMSLWTDGEVGLWLKVEISDILLEQNDAYIVVTEEANAIEDEQVTRFTMAQLKEEGIDSKGRYILKQSIASGEMTGDVTITAYDADGNQLCIGDYKKGADFLDDTNPKAVTRTVLDYVRLVLAADPETYADLRAMVTAMVTYGGYAQEYFGVDTENPAYGVLGEFGIDMPDLSLVSIDQELTITPSGAATAVLSELGDTAETEPSVSETEAEETVESSTEPTVTETTPEETVESETVPEETAAADETVPADTASGETQAETVVTESTESTEADTSAYTADVSISVMSVASTASTESTAETSGFGLEYASQTVTLDSKISLKTYFTLAEGTSIEDYTFTYTRQGSETTEELTAVQSGSRYYVLIENIPVAYWDSMYDLTVTDREGNTYTVSSSVLAWVQRCLTGTDQGTALNSLARAMFWYNQYANAYFGK